MAAFALLALLLAAVGIYRVLAYFVGQRVREIGVRMGLGASAGEVVRLVLFQGIYPITAGTVGGLAGSFACSRLLVQLLYGVSASDPLIYLAVPAFLLLTALLASYIPAPGYQDRSVDRAALRLAGAARTICQTLHRYSKVDAMDWSRRQFLGVSGAASLGLTIDLKAQSGSADLILFNGKIVTVDDSFSIHQAIVIKDGRILAVGSNELRNQYSAARTIDLRGRMVMPGFHDTHIHLAGHSRRYIDLNDTKSLTELKEQVSEKAKELGPNEWITGAGWDEYHFTEQRKPLRADLDAAAPNNPVVLTRAGGHSSVGNSKALELADINSATPDPPRGLIEKDGNGAPNGVIRERSDLYTRLVPKDKPADVRDSLFANVREQLKLGITSVIEAGSFVDPNVVGSYAEWELLYQKHAAELPRASIQVGYPSPAGEAKAGVAKLKEFGKKTGDGNEQLRVGSIGEMAADGGFTGPTAWSLIDYKGQPGFRGRAFFTPEQIHANIEEGHKLGWQFGIHAIGDAAIAMTVDALDTVLHDYPRNDHRHYLCHFTVLPPERTMDLMARDKILIAQQPNFTYNLEGRYVETLEGKRLTTNNALTTPIKKGIFMAFGSDNLPIGPMVGLYAAVTRKGESGKVYGPEQAVSMKDAITMYTRNGAFLTREEKLKGTLEVGKLADMIVLPEDLLNVSPDKVLNMKVDMTIVGGKILYEQATSA